ncbi:hypothetical protein [Thermodesulfitimonas sp.]
MTSRCFIRGLAVAEGKGYTGVTQRGEGKKLEAVFFTLPGEASSEAEAALAALIEVLLQRRKATPR